MSIKDEIDRTKSQVDAHRAAIVRLEAHGRALALKSLGLTVGDRIMVTSKRPSFEAEVTGVEWWDFRPTPRAMKIKKDGTASEKSAGWIDKWEKIATPTAPEPTTGGDNG